MDYEETKMALMGVAQFKREPTKEESEESMRLWKKSQKRRPFLLIDNICKLMEPYIVDKMFILMGSDFYAFENECNIDKLKEYLLEHKDLLTHFFIYSKDYIFFTRECHDFGYIWLHKLPRNPKAHTGRPAALASYKEYGEPNDKDFTLGKIGDV